MALVRQLLNRLHAITRRSRLEQQMQDELREHLERAAERFEARGMSPETARLAARREFGNVAMLEEESRDARGARWVDALAGDTKFAFRYFARHKATVAIIVAVLALGVGANTIMFAVFQAFFLRPAPGVPTDKGQVRIYVSERATRTAQDKPHDLSRRELTAFAAHPEIFSAVAAWKSDQVVLDGGDSTGARGVTAQFVTPNYFPTVGVRLAAGQGFAPDQDGTPDETAVMSYAMAELLAGGGNAAAVVGRRILVNERPLRVVGVAPPKFQGALKDMNDPQLWIPVSARAGIARVATRWLDDDGSLAIFARLAPGATADRATALVRQVVATTLPDSARRVGLSRTAFALAMREEPPSAGLTEATFVFSAVSLVGVLILLVAWMNVSSLMVAAAVGRRHEIAVRLSLGASRTRLLRQLVTESTLLALGGGALGSMIAWWLLTLLTKAGLDGLDLSPDVGTFAFVLALAVATGIVFGLSPALHATRGGVATALRDSGTGTKGRSRLQGTFVLLQILLSQPLLVMLAALLSTIVQSYEPGAPETTSRVITAGFQPLVETGAPSQRREAVDSLIPRIAERAEVQGVVHEPAAFSLRRVIGTATLARKTESDTVPTVLQVHGAAPGWFALVDVPIILGRDVSLADTAEKDYAVVIGSDVARKLWGDASPIGRRLASPALPATEQDSIGMVVVGVYDASRGLPGMKWEGNDVTGDQPPRVYTAHGKQWRGDRILVRTRGPAEPFLSTLHEVVRQSAPTLPVTAMVTLAQVDAQAYKVTLRTSMYVAAGGAAAVLLAALGLYGVVALAVQQRRREIGIRIAVGAQPMQVARSFLAMGVRVSVIALILGLPLSIGGLHLLITQGAMVMPRVNLYLLGGGIAAVLLAGTATATWMPARRAAKVDPALTLRIE